MSAIVGFLGLDGRPAKPEKLERMVEVLSHRGPDGRAIWIKGSVGLGHGMLHTTPESLNEHLPFERDDWQSPPTPGLITGKNYQLIKT